MNPSLISNKNFQPIVRIAAYNIEGELNTEEELWRVNKKEFRAALKNKVKWSNYLIKRFIQVYVDMDIIKENGDYYEFSRVDTSFAWTKLDKGTALYCFKYLSDFTTKVYCLLLYKYNKYKYNNPSNSKPFQFSRAQLCRELGFCDTTFSNKIKVEGALETLSKVGLIEYDAGPFYEYNSDVKAPVPWARLYKVNMYSTPQKNVAKRISKKNIEQLDDDTKAMFTVSEKESPKQFEEKPRVQETKPYSIESSTEIVVEEHNGEKTLDGRYWSHGENSLDNDTRKFNHEDGFDELCLAIRGFCLGENYSIEKSDRLSQLSIKMWGKDYTTVLEEKPNYSDLF